jgi:hypothetical protein
MHCEIQMQHAGYVLYRALLEKKQSLSLLSIKISPGSEEGSGDLMAR